MNKTRRSESEWSEGKKRSHAGRRSGRGARNVNQLSVIMSLFCVLKEDRADAAAIRPVCNCWRACGCCWWCHKNIRSLLNARDWHVLICCTRLLAAFRFLFPVFYSVNSWACGSLHLARSKKSLVQTGFSSLNTYAIEHGHGSPVLMHQSRRLH